MRQKATEATYSDLGLLLRLWAPFLTSCATRGSGISFFFPCLHPLHIIYQRELLCEGSYPAIFGVSFGARELRGSVRMLPTDTNTLDAICICSPGDARQPTKSCRLVLSECD